MEDGASATADNPGVTACVTLSQRPVRMTPVTAQGIR